MNYVSFWCSSFDRNIRKKRRKQRAAFGLGPDLEPRPGLAFGFGFGLGFRFGLSLQSIVSLSISSC